MDLVGRLPCSLSNVLALISSRGALKRVAILIDKSVRGIWLPTPGQQRKVTCGLTPFPIVRCAEEGVSTALLSSAAPLPIP